MKLADGRALLELISAVDGRPVNDETAFAWATILDNVSLGDAMQAAVEHFRNHPDKRIMPGHIVAGVTRAADERRIALRAALAPVTPFGYPPDDPRNGEALRVFEASMEHRYAPALTPAPRYVPPPGADWERDRRRTAARSASPVIADVDRIEQTEAARRRYLAVLGDMIERPTPGGSGDDNE